MLSRSRWAIVIAACLVTLLVGFGIASLGPPPPPWNEFGFAVSLSWEGTPVVGMDFVVVVTVHARSAELTNRPTFLSIEVGGLEILQGDPRGNPWGHANLWNLTGLDLTGGGRFAWSTTPVWGHEGPKQARVWWPRGALSDVQFLDSQSLDPSTVVYVGIAYERLLIEWPLQLGVTAEGDFSVGGNLRLDTTVRGVVSGPRTPSLLYLSVHLHPTEYLNRSEDVGDDPWRLANVWNLTGIDTSGGLRFSLDVTPVREGQSVPLEAVVWSPRADWSSVQFDGTGILRTPAAVRLWGSLTVDFAIA